MNFNRVINFWLYEIIGNWYTYTYNCIMFNMHKYWHIFNMKAVIGICENHSCMYSNLKVKREREVTSISISCCFWDKLPPLLEETCVAFIYIFWRNLSYICSFQLQQHFKTVDKFSEEIIRALTWRQRKLLFSQTNQKTKCNFVLERMEKGLWMDKCLNI